MGIFAPRAQRLCGVLLVLACVAVLMGADRRVGRVPAATGELTLLSGTSGTFDVMAANADLHGFELLSVRNGALGTTSVVDGVIHYSAHDDAVGVDRVGYQLLTDSGQRRLGELRVRVWDPRQAAVAMRVNLVTVSRSGVPVELREGDTVVAAGVTGADGVVDLTVPAGWRDEAMLTLHADGVAEGAYKYPLTWVSALGSVRQMRLAAARERLEASAWPPLRLGAASTALHATLMGIDPDAAMDEGAAMRAAAGVDPYRLMVGVVVMELLEAGERLPFGYDSVLQLLSDPVGLNRLRSVYWRQEVMDALAVRLADPAKRAALPARPYHAWFVEPNANGLTFGEGEGMVLREGGTGEYFTWTDRDDAGLQWQPHEAGLRVKLAEPLPPGLSVSGFTCELDDGSTHTYMVNVTTHRDTVDLLRMHAFAGVDYLALRWHVVVSEELYAPVPEDCETEVRPDYTRYSADYVMTHANVETASLAGPALAVPQTLLLGLDGRAGRSVTGLLDLVQETLTLEGFAPDIEVRSAGADSIEFDAYAEGDDALVRFELQRLREGLGGSATWAVVQRPTGAAPRGGSTTGVVPQALSGDFDWNRDWYTHTSWSETGTFGYQGREERWRLDAGAARALRYSKPLIGSDWTLMEQRHFLIEDGAAVRRVYQIANGPELAECPPDPWPPCWGKSEHRMLPVAELPDAFGPGYDLVFVMHEHSQFESADGWAVYRRFVDAWVRDPEGDLQQARPPEARRATGVRGASMQEH